MEIEHYSVVCFKHSTYTSSQAFQSPSFDCLQNAKMEGGKAWSILSRDDVSVYQGRQMGGGVPNQKNELEALSCSFYPKS